MRTFRNLAGFTLALVLMSGLAGAAGGTSSKNRLKFAQSNLTTRDADDHMVHDRDQPSPSMAGKDRMPRPEEHRMMMMRMKGLLQDQMSKMSADPSSTNTIALMDERIAFLKTELQITNKQTADWDALADALRSGRQHLLEGRKLADLSDTASSAERLASYEHHAIQRVNAITSIRAAFARLYPTLDDGQKHAADAIIVPLIATF